MSWVKFHDELTEGTKRGLSRAVRFVYMELSLRARKTKGDIKLPSGMDPVDAVHDLLGGDRKEIKTALATLTKPEDEQNAPMIVISGNVLRVTGWKKWNSVDDSKARVADFRKKQTEEIQGVESPCNALHPVTTPAPPIDCNDDVTVLDKSREEKKEIFAAGQPDKPAEVPVQSKPEPVKATKPAQAKLLDTEQPAETPAYKQVVDYYFVEFQATRGSKPGFGSREGKAAKELLAKVGNDPVRACAVIRSALRDPYWAGKATICTMASDPSRHIGSGNPSTPMPIAAPPGHPGPPRKFHCDPPVDRDSNDEEKA
jgi:hypothetical protein